MLYHGVHLKPDGDLELRCLARVFVCVRVCICALCVHQRGYDDGLLLLLLLLQLRGVNDMRVELMRTHVLECARRRTRRHAPPRRRIATIKHNIAAPRCCGLPHSLTHSLARSPTHHNAPLQ